MDGAGSGRVPRRPPPRRLWPDRGCMQLIFFPVQRANTKKEQKETVWRTGRVLPNTRGGDPCTPGGGVKGLGQPRSGGLLGLLPMPKHTAPSSASPAFPWSTGCLESHAGRRGLILGFRRWQHPQETLFLLPRDHALGLPCRDGGPAEQIRAGESTVLRGTVHHKGR